MKRFCGFIAGFVFFIAGIFKLLDPVGAGLVMKEYMDFLHLGFVSALAKPSAVALAFVEVLIGTALVTGIWRRLTAVAALIFQTFFTFLTLLLVILNPQMDCGCFGEVVHLTHIQTFIKNLVLEALLVAFAFPFRYLGGPKKHKYVSFGVVMLSVLAFSLYTWLYIPFVDYTAFKPAVALQAGSAFATVEDDSYEAVFVYEKDGKTEEFSLDELPDSTWTFVDVRTTPGSEQVANTVSLSFYDELGAYQDSLAVKGKVLVVSLYDAGVRQSVWEKVASFVSMAEEVGFTSLVLVSATDEQLNNVYAKLPQQTEILKRCLYRSDYKTLVTMNRSNGGVTYFSDGYLVKKWAAKSRPGMNELQEVFNGDDTETIIGSDAVGSLAFQGFLLYVFAVMLLL